MNNYKILINYDGTRYYGWEHQPNTDLTIQGKLESVLSQMTGHFYEGAFRAYTLCAGAVGADRGDQPGAFVPDLREGQHDRADLVADYARDRGFVYPEGADLDEEL